MFARRSLKPAMSILGFCNVPRMGISTRAFRSGSGKTLATGAYRFMASPAIKSRFLSKSTDPSTSIAARLATGMTSPFWWTMRSLISIEIESRKMKSGSSCLSNTVNKRSASGPGHETKFVEGQVAHDPCLCLGLGRRHHGKKGFAQPRRDPSFYASRPLQNRRGVGEHAMSHLIVDNRSLQATRIGPVRIHLWPLSSSTSSGSRCSAP